MSPKITRALIACIVMGIGIRRQIASAKASQSRSAWPDRAGEFAL
jgi:hypothetical protein